MFLTSLRLDPRLVRKPRSFQRLADVHSCSLLLEAKFELLLLSKLIKKKFLEYGALITTLLLFVPGLSLGIIYRTIKF